MEQYNQPTDLFLEEPAVYAGFWERFGAAFIDGIILYVVSLVIGLAFGAKQGEFGMANALGLVVNWLYYALQESGVNQATVGKRALGIKVTSLDNERISFGQATGRLFSRYIPLPLVFMGVAIGQPYLFIFIFAVLVIIFHLMMLWDSKSQALHDKLAGTLVVKAKA